jgi:membrane-associated phospholipid phosphatase
LRPLAVFIIFFTFFLSAQDKSDDSFPFELDGFKEVAIFSTGLVFSTSFLIKPYKDLSENDIAKLNADSVNSFDRYSTTKFDKKLDYTGDAVVYSLAAAPLGLIGLKSVNRDFRSALTFMVMYAESAMLINGLTRALKISFRRKRPYVYNDSLTFSQKMDSENQLSMPSNHTANAFNSAVFMSTVFTLTYPDSKWVPVVWSLSMSGAATVGLLRIFSGNHYPTDVIVGAVLGTVTGLAVPFLHWKKKKNVVIIPFAGDNYAGVSASGSF